MRWKIRTVNDGLPWRYVEAENCTIEINCVVFSDKHGIKLVLQNEEWTRIERDEESISLEG